MRKKFFFENCRKNHARPRADMEFPTLYSFNLTNFWKTLNLLGFSCTLMPMMKFTMIHSDQHVIK